MPANDPGKLQLPLPEQNRGQNRGQIPISSNISEKWDLTPVL